MGRYATLYTISKNILCVLDHIGLSSLSSQHEDDATDPNSIPMTRNEYAELIVSS
jgi:hypothetical protein